jgi:type IV secretion system protein VirD4
MVVELQDSGIVKIAAKDFPAIAVNVLEKLGYHVSRTSNQLDQIIAVEQLNEQVGRDMWKHKYKVVLQWSATAAGDGVVVEVELTELEGGATRQDCQTRCDKLIMQLQKDAARAIATRERKEPNTRHGAARWGTDEDLRKAGYFQSKADPKRLIIGKSGDGKYLQVPERSTHAHAIICGRTGVGKSRSFFIPNLIERLGTSLIVTEATPGFEAGELYTLTSGWRKKAGHEIYCFNPADMTSNRINPIDRVRNAPAAQKTAMAEQLAELVIMNGEKADSNHEQTWNRSEKLLLTPLILHAAASDPEQGHFGSLRWLILQGPDELRKILEKSPSRVAQQEFEGWMRLSGETNFKYGVFSGLITKLNPWMTDTVVALTETTDIDFKALKEQLFTFYLAVPSRSKDSKLLGSLMLNFLIDQIMEMRRQLRYPVNMLLDEFTNFGKISGIADVLSLIRKNEIGLMLGFQNYGQLEMVYSRKESQVIIDQPATQVYFRQKNFAEAKLLSDALGRTTVEEVTVTDSGRVQEFVQARQLITPDELCDLQDEVIVITAEVKPLKIKKTGIHAYDHALAYEPPERPEHFVSDYIINRGRVAGQKEMQQKQTMEQARKKGPRQLTGPTKATEKPVIPPSPSKDRDAPDYGDF